jgi:AraC-like DNA-binding protein/mannose-6-phosphate isomerase-like protein (cupin superfamily)
MRHSFPEEIDYVHTNPGSDLNHVWECRWGHAVGLTDALETEFPLHLRREHYDRTLDIPHWHKDFFALYVVRSGRGTRRVNGQNHSVARGDIFLMAPDNTHSWRVPVGLTIDGIYFGSRLWSEREWDALSELPELGSFLTPGSEAFAAHGHTDHFGHLSPDLHAQVETTLAAIRREVRQKTLSSHLAARARLFTLLAELGQWRASKSFTSRPSRGAAIAEVLGFCDENFHRQVSTEQLADMMHISRAHFFNLFKREVGMPPASYVRRLRLEHAQKLLVEKQHPIADIARLSGFQNATQLGRAFKNTFGISPLDFRKKQKASS